MLRALRAPSLPVAGAWRSDSKRLHGIAMGPPGSKRRAARRKLGKLLSASKRAEDRYVRDTLRIVRAIHRTTMEYVAPALSQVEHRQGRQDSRAVDLGGRFLKRLFVFTRTEVGKAHDRMAEQVQKNSNRTMKLIGLTPRALGLQSVVATSRENNIRLIENAGRAYVDDVRKILDTPKAFGGRVEDLQSRLWSEMKKRGGVSESRATLIARDQTLKLNAALSQHRFKEAGVAEYVWSTSQDERVRPMHAALEGETFSFADPPVTNEDGDTNNPGEDYQCRCVALPVIDELEPEEDEPPDEEDEPDEPDDDETPAALPGGDEPPDDEETSSGGEGGEGEPTEEPMEPDDEPAPEEPERGAASSLVGTVAGAGAAEIINGAGEHPIVRDILEKHPLASMSAQVAPNVRGEPVNGYYADTPGGALVVKSARSPASFGAELGAAGTFSMTGKTAAEACALTFTHELGHHVHMQHRDVDDIVKKAYRMGRPRGITPYAKNNPYEYFAESFAAYVRRPDELRARDPVGFEMVVRVLTRLGFATHPVQL